MSACNVEVVKLVGKYYNAPVGTICYNTDRVLTTVLDKQNVEGFASIILQLAQKSNLNKEQSLLCYQWLEHIAMYANQAASNPSFAKSFLEEAESAHIFQRKSTGLLPLPRQIFPHELKNASLKGPVIYHPQPFSYPGYPVILYL